MICPRCQLEFEGQSGVGSGGCISSDLKQPPESDQDSNSSLLGKPRARVRGKAREYSAAFETAWRAYGRKEEKLRAYGEWIIQARLSGGDTLLLPQILDALRWQTRIWAPDGWRFAPYFERYLKRRKWEDERPPTPQAVPRYIDDSLSQGTDRKIAQLRAAADRRATPEQMEELRKARGNG